MTDYSTPPGSIGPRVLVVDDDDIVLKLLRAILEKQGYVVLAANNGPDAVAICVRAPTIDLLITDFDMPEMTGLELARQCSRIYPRLPVLYVSGRHPDPELQADLQADRRGYIAKPFRRDDILCTARELLAA